ncbi:hypothetical protein Clacol_006211 [Clathrus columnatus]|uniref:MutS protein homolog 3 n=1 Tax=Clathrus columnatus TaxID=1419009 RepID=A0AAV5AEM8_9AGAM|nr:hypothetical protein Clacol_006211 [Clathrus columnatus]
MSTSQQTISSYFSAKKRKSQPSDLSKANDSDERHIKRLKASEENNPSLEHWAYTSKGSSANVTSLNREVTDANFSKTPKTRSHVHTEKTPSIREKLLRRNPSESQLKDVELDEIDEVELETPEIAKKSGRSRTTKNKAPLGPRDIPCTPLEEVVIRLKRKYPDIVLLIQVGYNFFGEDAKTAGKVLGFYFGWDRNFLRTSCPVNNLKANIGVVTQVETAALKKAGENRNTLFDRELTQLYTPSTFVDASDVIDDFGHAAPSLVVVVENTRGDKPSDRKIPIGILSIIPSTGDVLTELETRLAHIRPAELLLPPSLSASTEKMLRHFETHGHIGRIRVERLKKSLDYSTAFRYMSEKYEKDAGELPPSITDLPELVIIALALAMKHLTSFQLTEALLQPAFFNTFSSRAHMLLNSRTIKNLEIFQNQTDFTEAASLFAILNRTVTPFGKRLLKDWLGRPLVDRASLEQRINAVEELREGETHLLALLRGAIKALPDLAKGLANIQYGRCMPKELLSFLTALKRVGLTFKEFQNVDDVPCKTALWREIIFPIPKITDPVEELLGAMKMQAARDNNKIGLWMDSEQYPGIEDADFAILHVENDLANELKKIRKLLKSPSLGYVSVLNDEFLIEIPKTNAKDIPANWIRMGSTKNVLRYHTPEIIRFLEERERHKETRLAEAEKAYKAFLHNISEKYYALFRDVVNKLATADCLMSLAIVSLDNDFCKPEFVEGNLISIKEGCHPIIAHVRTEPFVPNSIDLGGESARNLVISGPNMGGKSSVVKLVALLVLMAQIGSYVPAKSMRLTIHDAILTRMGASDDLAAGRSTFMVELSETKEIIGTATENSLVILDELGVGTSTFDGMAIAGAVLEHLCQEIRCKTLFITHYPSLALELEARYPDIIANKHMGYIEDIRIDGRREIRLLYRLVDGVCKASFGIECARLAGLPNSILEEATEKAANMQQVLNKRAERVRIRTSMKLLHKIITSEDDDQEESMKEFKFNWKLLKLLDRLAN